MTGRCVNRSLPMALRQLYSRQPAPGRTAGFLSSQSRHQGTPSPSASVPPVRAQSIHRRTNAERSGMNTRCCATASTCTSVENGLCGSAAAAAAIWETDRPGSDTSAVGRAPYQSEAVPLLMDVLALAAWMAAPSAPPAPSRPDLILRAAPEPAQVARSARDRLLVTVSPGLEIGLTKLCRHFGAAVLYSLTSRVRIGIGVSVGGGQGQPLALQLVAPLQIRLP